MDALLLLPDPVRRSHPAHGPVNAMQSSIQRVLTLSGALLLFALPLSAQTTRVVISGGGQAELFEELMDLGYLPAGVQLGQPQSAPPAGDGAAAPADPMASLRLNKLKALEYDRRPSAALAAWSKPAPAAETPTSGAGAPGEPKPEANPLEIGLGEAELGEAVVGEAAVGGSSGAEAVSDAAEAADSVAPPSEADAAAEAAALAAKAQAAEAARQAELNQAVDREAADLGRAVTLGDWEYVRAYLQSAGPTVHGPAYQQLLTSLQRGPQQRTPVPPQGQPYLERNRFSPADILGLASAAPRGENGAIEPGHLSLLGQLLSQAFQQGHQVESFLAGVTQAVLAGDAVLSAREFARVLVAADRPLFLGEFLPSLEQAIADDDREALNLIARHAMARHGESGLARELEAAWHATLAVLAVGEVSEEAKVEAIERAVELAPRISEDLGLAWLESSFTERPERGMEILAAIGSSASKALSALPMAQDARERLLRLQRTSAEALLDAAPELAATWGRELELLAANWLREAQLTYQLDQSTRRGPGMQRDVYGNVFYFDSGMQFRGNQAQPIPTAKVLELAPSPRWMDWVGETLRPRLDQVLAQLLLKVKEEAEAFPHIERLARTNPRVAKGLVDEFLDVWAQNHNPNDQNRRANSYVFFFGFEERAAAIPLTRSKQERNLEVLAGWVQRLKALPVEVDNDRVVAAFRAAHSSAEVYRVETLERIFGSLGDLEPSALASLMQGMRANLASIWRDPAEQERAKTNRRQKDIQAEVLRGYEMARATLDRARGAHPMSHELVLASAALLHDENNFRQEIAKDPEFSARRAEAFAEFERAAELYARWIEGREKDEESTDVYDTWFHAALGAADLRALRSEQVLVRRQVEAVREALQALPGEARKRHMDRIASQIFARMGALQPAVKYRYVREALTLVGDHELAREARDLAEYYGDLVSEVQLETRVDGSDQVGSTQPFGLIVDLVHTAAIEREAGGFSKYLQNQNQNPNAFAFNYGRPTEDYREKFETMAREALGEHFRVLSVTFNDPKAHSVAGNRYGWRVTPYAYLLLEPKGPEVDAVGSLRLDMDFLDISGYAVLPVESPVLPIDARGSGVPRPLDGLALTQVLDERQAAAGKLLVEVKASSVGIPPPLSELLELERPGFELVQVVDNGPAVVQFNPEGEGVLVERTGTLEYRGLEGLAALPTSFEFPAPRLESRSAEYFRYVDADLVQVDPRVPLEQRYGEARATWPAWVLGGLLAVASVGALVWVRRRRAQPDDGPLESALPQNTTPFTVLAYLRTLGERAALDPAGRNELEAEIELLERHFFGDSGERVPDLADVAVRWSRRVGAL